MPRVASHDRFVRAVYRRLVMVRALERAGACMCVAGGLCLVGALVLMWRGEDALELCAGALLIGAAMGLGWGLIRRPRLIDAAVEADRQFRLCDLLSSALLSRADDAWSRAVVAMADQRCRGLSSNAVVLHRLGARAWGGIGLSFALVLTVGVMSNVMMQERTSAGAREEISPAINATHPARDVAPAQPKKLMRERVASGHERAMRAGSDEPAGESSSYDSGEDPASNQAGSSAHEHEEVRHRQAAGAGAMSSASPEQAWVRALDDGGSLGREPDADAKVTSGGGSAGDLNLSGSGGLGAGAGGTVGSAKEGSGQRDRPPWQSSNWSSDRDTALQAVRQGKVPDRSRDVVREYFKP